MLQGCLTLSLWAAVLLSPFLLSGSMGAGGWSKSALRVNQTDEQPPERILNLTTITNIQTEMFSNFSNEFIPVAFQNSNDSALSGTAADAEWAALYPPNGGWIQTKLSNFTVQLSVSTFHAIHCLNTLRQVTEVFFDVASNETNTVVANGTAGDFFHMQHCLIYLRQMVMCSSDTALEHDILLPNGTIIRLGDGTVHTCRNFDELRSMLHW